MAQSYQRKDQATSAPPPPWWRRCRPAFALLLFAVSFVGESVYSYSRTSATADEPVHLASGYFALALSDYRVDLSDPPLVRMWAAIPLLWQPVASDPSAIDAKTPDTWGIISFVNESHRFLYVQNDADALLYRARLMVVLLGVLLATLLFFWVREWLGFGAAAATLAMLALEPNLVAHHSLATTDAGIAAFIVGALYFTWRTIRRVTLLNVIGLCVFCALSVSTKYSAALLCPIVAVLLAIAAYPLRRLRVPVAAALVILVVATSYVAVWGAYRFQYAPSSSATWLFSFHDNPYVVEQAPMLASVVRWIDRRHLLPNAFSEGALLGQARVQRRSAFLGGQYSETGWWYYLPVAMLFKMPLALLLLIGWGSHILFLRSDDRVMLVCVAVTIAGFLVPAMATQVSTGLRHVLIVFPFLLLLAALPVQRLLAMRGSGGRWCLAIVAALWATEYARAYPHPLAFFNMLGGGPARGERYLVDSNIDWGQDLKALSQWVSARRIPEINLAYYGAADPTYYGMKVTYLNGSPPFVPSARISAPKLPGYVAISKTVLSGVFVDEPRRAYYRPLRQMQPLAVIGHSINVYWVEKPWWPT